MTEPLALRRKLGLLLGIGRRRVDLAELVTEQVQISLPGAVALAQDLELAGEGADVGVRRAVLIAELDLRIAAETIEHGRLSCGKGQLAVLVLPVEGEEPRAKRTQIGGRRRAAADERARPARGTNAPAEDDLVRAVGQPLGKLAQVGVLEEPVRDRKDALDIGLLGTRAHDLRSRAAAHQAGRANARARSCRPRSHRLWRLARSPKRSSARSIRSRFSIRNSMKHAPLLAPPRRISGEMRSTIERLTETR